MFVGVVALCYCVVLITECHNSYKHRQISLTSYKLASLEITVICQYDRAVRRLEDSGALQWMKLAFLK